MSADAFIPVAPAGDWICPCGEDPPKKGSTATPVQTSVSLRESCCPFCGRTYRDEYRRGPGELAP